MASKSKPAKPKARKIKRPSKAVLASKMKRDTTVLHKLHGDPKRMLKLEWSADHNDFVGTPVNLNEAARITSNANPPFCKNKLDDPAQKYYCEFSVQDNQYVCTLVDADDPRCT
jgi:hypothetical protein